MTAVDGYSELEVVIQSLGTFSAVLSFLGCVTILYSIYRKKTYNIITNRLLIFLLLLEVGLSIVYGIGLSGTLDEGVCQFQGTLIQWFGLASILWVTNMSIQMYRWIVLRESNDQLLKNVNFTFLAVMSLAGIIAFTLLGLGAYGNATTWCWISFDFEPLRFYLFYLILIAAWIFMILMLYLVSKYLRKNVILNSSHFINTQLQKSERDIQNKLALYVFAFVFSWFFGLLNRFVGYLYDRPVVATSVMMAFFLPLQGFLFAICFGNLVNHVKGLLTSQLWVRKIRANSSVHRSSEYIFSDLTNSSQLIKSNNPLNNVGSTSNSPLNQSELSIPQHKTSNYTSKRYSIFTTTFNLGEAGLDAIKTDMIDWILPGHDVYVVSFQECIDLTSVRLLIHEQLGGPSEFTMYTAEIGSGNTNFGYHGFIGMTVFVRTSEVIAGNIRPTGFAAGNMATGTNLIVTTAQNKGAVGLPFQIHDTSIGFVGCHLPSDSKGASKLSKRNASSHGILRQLNLSSENVGFDLHLQHDHLVFMGDLNYRTDTINVAAGVNFLNNIASACSVEKNILDDDPSWLKRKYNFLRSVKDPLFPSSEEIRKQRIARVISRGAWESVLRSDELRMIIEDGDAFCSFDEPLPSFAPSYKRRKGVKGHCGDYTDLNLLTQGYSNIGNETEIAVMVQLLSSGKRTNWRHLIPKVKKKTPAVVRNDPASVSATASAANNDKRASTGFRGAGRKLSLLMMGTRRGSGITMNDSSEMENSVEIGIRGQGSSTAANALLRSQLARSKSTNDAQVKHPFANKESEKGISRSLTSVQEEHGEHDGKTQNKFEVISPLAALAENVTSNRYSSHENTPAITALNDSEASRRAVSGRFVELNDDMSVSETKKFRPPSYTDRILVHSLDDRKSRLTVQAYDFCDSMRVSDHRPVSMTFQLEVNGSVKFHDNALDSLERCREGFSVGVYELAILNLSVTFGLEEFGDDDNIDDESDSGDVFDDFDDDDDDHEHALDHENETGRHRSSSSARQSPGSNLFRKSSHPNLADEEAPRLSDVYGGNSSGRKTVTAPLINLSRPKLMTMFDELSPEDEIDMSPRSDSSWNGGIGLDDEDKSSTTTWRKKVEHEEMVRKMLKTADRVYSVKKKLNRHLKIKTAKKKDDKIIANVSVVFPMPAKDPLTTNRKINDIAKAMNEESMDLLSSYREIAEKCITPDVQLENSAKHIEKVTADIFSVDALEKPVSVFGWQEVPRENQASDTSQRSVNMKLSGVVSPELGSHALLKFTNKAGYVLGESVVCLSHLTSSNPLHINTCSYDKVLLSSGGQRRGHISGTFVVRLAKHLQDSSGNPQVPSSISSIGKEDSKV